MSNCEAFACAATGCQATIHLHHDVEARLRRTHETFYCPAGHHNYFPGQTDEEKRLRAVEKRATRFRELLEDAIEERDEWKLQAKQCPFECGFRVLRKWKPDSIAFTLACHLVEAHGAAFPEPDEALAGVQPPPAHGEGE